MGIRDLSRRALLQNLFLVFVSVSVTIMGLEAGLRFGVVPYDQEVESRAIYCDSPEQFHQFHPEYGWTLVPNSTYIRHWKRPNGNDSWLLFEINEEGFRDVFDSGSANIIVLGDSFTEGAGVTKGGQYPYLLDRWAKDTAFRTYAAGGYGTDQQMLIYRNVADRFEHDVVVLQFYLGNDVRNNAGKGWPPGPRRPRFELQNGSLEQVHEPVNDIPEGAAGFRDYGRLGIVHQTLRDTSFAYDWLFKRNRRLLVKAGVLHGGGAVSEFDAPTGDELRSQLKLTRALVEQIGIIAETEDAEVLIVAVPARGDVDPSNPEHYPPTEGEPYYEAQRSMLQKIAETNDNIGLLDLKPVMKRNINDGRQVYGSETGHFTPYGYRVMAKQIYGRLVADGHLTEDASVDFTAKYTKNIRTCREIK